MTTGLTPKGSILRQINSRQYRSHSYYPSKSIVPYVIPNKFNPLLRYSKSAYCGEFSPDGRYFISSCQNGRINIYKVLNSMLVNEFTFYSNSVQWTIIDTKLSPDNRFVAYSSWSGSVHLIPFREDQTEIQLVLSESSAMAYYDFYRCAFSLSFSEDSKELIAGTNSGIICIYDLNTCSKVVSINNAHITDVNTVSFSNNSNHIIYSAADDGVLKIWDRRILSESRPMPSSVFVGHIHGITYHDSKGDFRYILTNSKDQTIKLWDTRRPANYNDVRSAERVVQANSIYWDYRHDKRRNLLYHRDLDKKRAEIFKDLQDRRKNMTKIEKDVSVATYEGHAVSATLIRARFSPAYSTLQKYIYTGDATGKVIIYDIDTTKIVSVVSSHGDVVRDVSWHPYEPLIVTSSFDQIIGSITYRDPSECEQCVSADYMEGCGEGEYEGSDVFEEDFEEQEEEEAM